MSRYIDADIAQEKIKELCDKYRIAYGEKYGGFAEHISKITDEVPTAGAQEVKHGKWCHLGGDEWCCNRCGDIISTEGSWEKPEKKYCSECGAKMDRSNNETDN